MKHKFNYFYKITNTINGHFYYGIHSTDNLDDGYMGSGTRLKATYKKYGMENFEKEILKFFNTRKEASDYEAEMVTEELIKNDNCYNIVIGGEKYNSSGNVTVYDNVDNVYKLIRCEEYEINKSRYASLGKGKISVIDKTTNEKKKILVEDYKNNKDKYVCFSKNKVPVKDKYGKFFLVDKEDERYLNGTLLAVGCGRKHTDEEIEKVKTTFKKIKHQQGQKNSQYGTCWITKNGENKKIKKEDIDNFILEGWVKGRKI